MDFAKQKKKRRDLNDPIPLYLSSFLYFVL